MDFPEKLSETSREQFLKYAYISKATGNYILCSDDTRFFNHSKDNNVINISSENEQESIDIAARDIQAGEELTYDYKIQTNNTCEIMNSAGVKPQHRVFESSFCWTSCIFFFQESIG